MKKYKKYMDGVEAPDTLHQRLMKLKEEKKSPAPWAKYGSIAAALVLVFGGLSMGIHRYVRQSGYLERLFHENAYYQEIESTFAPDIAKVAPSDEYGPGEKTLGGYDVVSGSGSGATVAHYILPYIDYGASNEGASQKIAMDWAIQDGAVERELTQDQIVILLGGTDAASTHLDWGAYELTGRVWEWPDGRILLAYIYGYAGPLDHFEFSIMDGQLPPTCIAYPSSVTQQIYGLTVTADKFDGEHGCDRRVSFMKDDCGYRFDLTSTDTEQAELLVSRLVRQVADQGMPLACTCVNCGNSFPVGSVHNDPFIGVGEPNYEDGVPAENGGGTYTCPDCGQTLPVDGMRAHVHSFNPEAADPQYNAPPVSVSDSPGSGDGDWFGTPNADPDEAICSGYPVPEGGTTCPICGQTLPAGMEHSHEVCGYPLAPATHICEVCGQSLPEGVEHSHGGHHGDHH